MLLSKHHCLPCPQRIVHLAKVKFCARETPRIRPLPGLSQSRGFGSQATGEWLLSSFVTPQPCQILLFVPIHSPAGLPQNPKGCSRCSPESESSLHSVFVEAEGVCSCVRGLKGTKPRPCLPEAKFHCQTGHSSLCMQRFQTLIDWLSQ